MRIVKTVRQVFVIGQQELADLSGVSVRELARIEAGEQVPRPDTANAISTAIERLIAKRAIKLDQEPTPVPAPDPSAEAKG